MREYAHKENKSQTTLPHPSVHSNDLTLAVNRAAQPVLRHDVVGDMITHRPSWASETNLEAKSATSNAPYPGFDFSRIPIYPENRPIAQRFPGEMLRTSAPDSPAEQQAYHIADNLTDKPIPERPTASVGLAPRSLPKSIMAEGTRGGEPLPMPLRFRMERQFGMSFEDVRVHTGQRASATAESAGARALTMGQHIVFGENQYQPNTSTGQRLIAHELTHVAQVKHGAPADIVFGLWTWRAENTLLDQPGTLRCYRSWPIPAVRALPGQQRWVAKVEYFCPFNALPLIGCANSYWAIIQFPSSVSFNPEIIVNNAHAVAWFDTRQTFPSPHPSQPGPSAAFASFRFVFQSEIVAGLTTAGIPYGAATVTILERAPAGCPCP